LKELQPALEQLGFEFEVIEKDKSVLVGLPVNISEKQAQQVLEQLILDLKEGVPESGFCQNDSIAKSLAQSLSIKKGMLLTEKEQTNIVDALFACKQPDYSPFGKTTFITMKLEELDKRF